MGGGPRTGGAPKQPQTSIDWIEVALESAVTETGKDARSVSTDEHLSSLFRARSIDEDRPTLLYFHYDHKPDAESGEKLSANARRR